MRRARRSHARARMPSLVGNYGKVLSVFSGLNFPTALKLSIAIRSLPSGKLQNIFSHSDSLEPEPRTVFS